jgi:lantibiotic modifying enzyme
VLKEFDTVSIKRISDTNQKSDDPTMHSGSAGILFSLYKYNKLLNKETEHLKPNWLQPLLDQAIA